MRGVGYPSTVSGTHVIGVDLGGTKILSGVIDRDGEVERRYEIPTPLESQEALFGGLDAAVEALLDERGVRYVSFEDWQAIDQAEIGRGEPHGRPRVKFVRVEEMLETLGERVSG